MKQAKAIFIGAVLLAAVSAPAQAQTAESLSLELNAAQPSEKGCRLTFVVNNGLGKSLTKATFEIVLFDKSGVVDRITVLDFRDLVAGKTKVSRFDLAGVDCSKLGRVLVNTVNDCVGDGLAADACSTQLKTSTKSEIEFGV